MKDNSKMLTKVLIGVVIATIVLAALFSLLVK